MNDVTPAKGVLLDIWTSKAELERVNKTNRTRGQRQMQKAFSGIHVQMCKWIQVHSGRIDNQEHSSTSNCIGYLIDMQSRRRD